MFGTMSLTELRQYRSDIRKPTYPGECLSGTMRKLIDLEIKRRESGGTEWEKRIKSFY